RWAVTVGFIKIFVLCPRMSDQWGVCPDCWPGSWPTVTAHLALSDRAGSVGAIHESPIHESAIHESPRGLFHQFPRHRRHPQQMDLALVGVEYAKFEFA